MEKDYSRIEVTVTCSKCKYKDRLSAILTKSEEMKKLDYVCPICKARRSVVVTKAMSEDPVALNKSSVKKFAIQHGKKVELDSDGNPIKREKHIVSTHN